MGAVSTLAECIADLVTEDGVFVTEISGLYLSRLSSTNPPPHTVDSAMFCATAQGQKNLLFGKEKIHCGARSSLVMSFGVPIWAQVIEASLDVPFLGLSMTIDVEELTSFQLAQYAPDFSKSGPVPNVYVSPLDDDLEASLVRLLRLLKTPALLPALVPVIKREIFFRLFSSDKSGLLASLTVKNSQAQRISRAVTWLRAHFMRALTIKELAREAGMSPPSLHHWFKIITHLSPMQYQKLLRLQHARQLLYLNGSDAASVSYEVGYESPTQFNREYKRQFGAPPVRDIERLRDVAGGLNATPKVLSFEPDGTIRLPTSRRAVSQTSLVPSRLSIANTRELSGLQKVPEPRRA